MRRKLKNLAILPLFVVLFASIAPAQSASPAIQRASCVLRNETDERFGPAASSSQTLVAALTSTALIDPAMEAAVKLSPTDWPTVAQVDVQPTGEAAVKLTVTVKPTDRLQLPDDAAKLVLNEITSRLLKSYNGDTPVDESTDAQAQLRKQRADLDVKLAALRTELDTAMQLANRREGANRQMAQAQIETQIGEARIEIAVQSAAIKVINEQLPAIEKDPDVEMKPVRAKLIAMRIDAQISSAKAEARIAELNARVAEWATNSSTTQPTRSPMLIQSEQSELMTLRNQLDNQINQLISNRSNRPSKGKLVVVGGASK